MQIYITVTDDSNWGPVRWGPVAVQIQGNNHEHWSSREPFKRVQINATHLYTRSIDRARKSSPVMRLPSTRNRESFRAYKKLIG